MNQELQSTNEELQTVNEELHQRTEEVNRANAFFRSVVCQLALGRNRHRSPFQYPGLEPSRGGPLGFERG